MKKIVRNLVILTGTVVGIVLVKKAVNSKTEKAEENKNTCFCSWEKIEENSGYKTRDKVKQKSL